MTTNGTETLANGNSDKSVLDQLHAEFVANYKGKTSKKRIAELVSAYLAATSTRGKAEAAVEAAIEAESNAAKAIIREASGKQKVTMGGNLFMPMSRGPRVYLRKESGDSLDLG